MDFEDYKNMSASTLKLVFFEYLLKLPLPQSRSFFLRNIPGLKILFSKFGLNLMIREENLPIRHVIDNSRTMCNIIPD